MSWVNKINKALPLRVLLVQLVCVCVRVYLNFDNRDKISLGFVANCT